MKKMTLNLSGASNACFQISPADEETSKLQIEFFFSSGFDCQGEDNHNSQV